MAALSDDIAAEIARALLTELKLPYAMRQSDKKRAVEKLWPNIPSRGELTPFQQHAYEDAPKAALKNDICDDEEEIKNIFCMIHGEFACISGTDIDHGRPLKEIQEAQASFLRYLNSDRKFSKKFLAQPAMDDFFQHSQSQVMGTEYFYKVCYNNLKNLWLICHACNITKSKKEFLAWAGDQRYFGQAFIKQVNDAGGIQSGVIFDSIGGAFIGHLPLDADNALRPVFSGGMGLGEYARTWFLEQRADLYKMHKQFYGGAVQELKQELEEIEALRDSGQEEEANKRTKTLQKYIETVEALFKDVKKIRNHDSDSKSEPSSSDDETGTVRQQRSIAATIDHFKENLQISHHVGKIIKQLRAQYNMEADFQTYSLDLVDQICAGRTTEDAVQELRRVVEEKIETSPCSWEQMKSFLDIEIPKCDFRERLRFLNAEKQIAEQKNQQANQEILMERMQRTLAEQQAQDEREQRALAERQAQEEREQRALAEQQTQDERGQRTLAEQQAQDERGQRALAERQIAVLQARLAALGVVDPNGSSNSLDPTAEMGFASKVPKHPHNP